MALMTLSLGVSDARAVRAPRALRYIELPALAYRVSCVTPSQEVPPPSRQAIELGRQLLDANFHRHGHSSQRVFWATVFVNLAGRSRLRGGVLTSRIAQTDCPIIKSCSLVALHD